MPKGQYDRSTMNRSEKNRLYRLNVDTKALMDNGGFQQTYQRKACGMKKGDKKNFNAVHKPGDLPRTPFEALRFQLKLTQTDWAECLEVSSAMISGAERGTTCASVPLAKRMQEEAWKRGVPVTLDELFQHVIPWRIEKEEKKEPPDVS
jgi:DNA-binding transcriptional regulator YiaG